MLFGSVGLRFDDVFFVVLFIVIVFYCFRLLLVVFSVFSGIVFLLVVGLLPLYIVFLFLYCYLLVMDAAGCRSFFGSFL